MICPPSFLNIMTHLLVKLVKEVHILVPVFLSSMFPFERFFSVLKNYFFFFQAEDGIRDDLVTGSSDVCSSDLWKDNEFKTFLFVDNKTKKELCDVYGLE